MFFMIICLQTLVETAKLPALHSNVSAEDQWNTVESERPSRCLWLCSPRRKTTVILTSSATLKLKPGDQRLAFPADLSADRMPEGMPDRLLEECQNTWSEWLRALRHPKHALFVGTTTYQGAHVWMSLWGAMRFTVQELPRSQSAPPEVGRVREGRRWSLGVGSSWLKWSKLRARDRSSCHGALQALNSGSSDTKLAKNQLKGIRKRCKNLPTKTDIIQRNKFTFGW